MIQDKTEREIKSMPKRWFHIFITVLISTYITSCSYSKANISSETRHPIYLKSHTLKGFTATTKYSLYHNIKFSPNGKLLAVYQASDFHHATIKIWNTKTGKLIYKTKVGGGKGYDDRTAQTRINFLPEGKTLILDGQIGPMVRWDFTQNKETKNICAGEYTEFVSISDDRKYIHMHTVPGSNYLCGANDNTVYYAGRFLDAYVALTKNNKLRASYPAKFQPYRKGDPYGTEIPRQSMGYNHYLPLEKSMEYIEIRENVSPKDLKGIDHNAKSYQHKMHNDLKQILSLWNSSTKKIMKLKAGGNFSYHAAENSNSLENSQYSIEFSPDGKTIAILSDNKELTLWTLGYKHSFDY